MAKKPITPRVDLARLHLVRALAAADGGDLDLAWGHLCRSVRCYRTLKRRRRNGLST